MFIHLLGVLVVMVCILAAFFVGMEYGKTKLTGEKLTVPSVKTLYDDVITYVTVIWAYLNSEEFSNRLSAASAKCKSAGAVATQKVKQTAARAKQKNASTGDAGDVGHEVIKGQLLEPVIPPESMDPERTARNAVVWASLPRENRTALTALSEDMKRAGQPVVLSKASIGVLQGALREVTLSPLAHKQYECRNDAKAVFLASMAKSIRQTSDVQDEGVGAALNWVASHPESFISKSEPTVYAPA